MKRLNILLTILFFALYSNSNAQEKEDKSFANFEIIDARQNGEDITDSVLKEKYSYVFYKIPESDTVQFAYLSGLNDSQTYGPIYLVTKEINSNNARKEEIIVYNFFWSYNYTQYIDKGTVKVKLLVAYKPQGKYFELHMKFENLEEYVFKGKMDGDLSFLDIQAGKTE